MNGASTSARPCCSEHDAAAVWLNGDKWRQLAGDPYGTDQSQCIEMVRCAVTMLDVKAAGGAGFDQMLAARAAKQAQHPWRSRCRSPDRPALHQLMNKSVATSRFSPRTLSWRWYNWALMPTLPWS